MEKNSSQENKSIKEDIEDLDIEDQDNILDGLDEDFDIDEDKDE